MNHDKKKSLFVLFSTNYQYFNVIGFYVCEQRNFTVNK